MQEDNITVQQIQELFAQHGAGKALNSPIKIHEYQDLIPKGVKLQKLGEGGQGCVYLIELRGIKYAIKIMKQTNDQQSLIKDFYNECKSFLSVNDEFVLRIVGYAIDTSREDKYRFCYYTNYQQKRSLSDLIKNKCLLQDQQIDFKKRFVAKLKLLCQITQGLNAIHQANLIHRDIKSLNILLNESDSPKIADLGLAREQSESKTNGSKGTYKYMAPETFQSKIYQKSDI